MLPMVRQAHHEPPAPKPALHTGHEHGIVAAGFRRACSWRGLSLDLILSLSKDEDTFTGFFSILLARPGPHAVARTGNPVHDREIGAPFEHTAAPRKPKKPRADTGQRAEGVAGCGARRFALPHWHHAVLLSPYTESGALSKVFRTCPRIAVVVIPEGRKPYPGS